jgi:hypothetical protein
MAARTLGYRINNNCLKENNMTILKYTLRALGLLLAGVGLASLLLGHAWGILDIVAGMLVVELSHLKHFKENL